MSEKIEYQTLQESQKQEEQINAGLSASEFNERNEAKLEFPIEALQRASNVLLSKYVKLEDLSSSQLDVA